LPTTVRTSMTHNPIAVFFTSVKETMIFPPFLNKTFEPD
jgi:hypothetical protein